MKNSHRKSYLLLSITLFIQLNAGTLLSQELLPDFESLKIAKVENVVDGDTVKLDLHGNKNCRLIGVNTPEEDELFYQEAKEFLSALLEDETVWVDEIQENDTHGRPLIYLYRFPDGLFVNLEIVRQGYSRVFMERNLKNEYLQIFYDSQASAMDAHLNIWQDVTLYYPQIFVFKTKSGLKYHTETCRYLYENGNFKGIKITLDIAKDQKLTPCKVCKPPEYDPPCLVNTRNVLAERWGAIKYGE